MKNTGCSGAKKEIDLIGQGNQWPDLVGHVPIDACVPGPGEEREEVERGLIVECPYQSEVIAEKVVGHGLEVWERRYESYADAGDQWPKLGPATSPRMPVVLETPHLS